MVLREICRALSGLRKKSLKRWAVAVLGKKETEVWFSLPFVNYFKLFKVLIRDKYINRKIDRVRMSFILSSLSDTVTLSK